MASKVLKKDADVGIVRVRRRQERAALTRQKILRAAAVEFALVGFDGATTRSIAARAKVWHGLVIYHFESKQNVWHSVTEDALEYFHSEFTKRKEELEGSDDVTRLRELLRVSIRVSAKRPELNWILSHEGENAARVYSLVKNIIGPDIDLTIDLIRKAQSVGQYVEGDPAHLHYLFVGASVHLFMMPAEFKRTTGQSPFNKAFLERHIEHCERLFFRDPPKTKSR